MNSRPQFVRQGLILIVFFTGLFSYLNVIEILQNLNIVERPEELVKISTSIATADVRQLAVQAFWIVIFAPITEEIAFRGLLWWLIIKMSSLVIKTEDVRKKIAWLITSALFALAHIEPAHVLGVLPAAIIFGYFKYKYNSIYRTIFLHMLNNALIFSILRLFP